MTSPRRKRRRHRYIEEELIAAWKRRALVIQIVIHTILIQQREIRMILTPSVPQMHGRDGSVNEITTLLVYGIQIHHKWFVYIIRNRLQIGRIVYTQIRKGPSG